MNSPRKSPPRILIVEDDPVSQKVLASVIRREGFGNPHIIDNGIDGLSICLKDPPDLLFLDLDLPRLHGEDLLRMLRSSTRLKKFPVAVLSSFAEHRQQELDLLRIGANRTLNKPLDNDQIREVLWTFLGDEDGRTNPFASKEFIRQSLDTLMDDGSAEASILAATGSLSDPSGKIFHGFEIREMIGSGGMGTVYKALQTSLGRTVALKVLVKSRADDETVVQRFREEARIMASLSHRNVLQVIDAGATSLTLYIAMEFIGGGTLADRLREGIVELPEFVNLATQISNALIYLHDQNIVHRDIKPGNIFLTADGSVKVGDFGISRAIGISTRAPEDDEDRYRYAGTPTYMAPELAAGEPATSLSDQYSFGRTLLRTLLPASKNLNPLELRAKRPDIPAGVGEALGRSVAWNAAERFPTVEEMKRELLAAARQPVPR